MLRKLIAIILISLSFSVDATLPVVGSSDAPDDIRYCGEPVRNSNGTIKRSQSELKKFVSIFPCPSTLEKSATCSGWAIDHVIPLASGGCDTTVNMQWLPDSIKSCAGTNCKDRWERKYHATPRQIIK